MATSSLSTMTLRELISLADQNNIDTVSCESKDQIITLLSSKGITSKPQGSGIVANSTVIFFQTLKQHLT